MSVIAYDGTYIAADRQGTNADLRIRVTKLVRRIPSGLIMGFTGMTENGLAMVEWYEGGADPAKFPYDSQNRDDWSRLIVVEPAARYGVRVHKVLVYERLPFAQRVEDEKMAWGSGRDFALGAMAMGATAAEAVEVASRYCTGCGGGVDYYSVNGEG